MTACLPAGQSKTNWWTQEQVAELLRRAKNGESASTIAAAIGKSRCAVLGKLDRLEAAGGKIERRGAILKQGSSPAKGVAARPAPSLPSLSVAKLRPSKRGRPAYSQLIGPVAAKPLPEPVPFVNGARITLLQLSSSTCKWPIGDPQSKDFCFCGHAPREKSPYCEYHARAAYVPMQDRAKTSKLPPIPLPAFNGLSK